MSRSKKFIAVLEDTVNTAKLQQIWKGLQLQSGNAQANVQVNELQEDEDKGIQQLLSQESGLSSSKKCVLSIELMEGKLDQVRKVLSKAECQLLRLVKVPAAFSTIGRQIPSQIMRDQF